MTVPPLAERPYQLAPASAAIVPARWPGTCHDDAVILVAGEALVDLVVAGHEVSAAAGGAPYNVARACARLGEEIALLASISGDGFGRLLEAGLADAGVARDLLQRTDQPTTLAVAQLDPAGGATYTFYVAGTSVPLLQPGAVPAGTDVLVAGGLGLVLEPMATGVERLLLGAPAEVLVVLDVNCRPVAIGDRDRYVERVRRIVARADVVKASDEDLRYLAPEAEAEEAARWLLGHGAGVVLVTAGADATLVVSAAGTVRVPVGAVDVVDTIGAGDSFTAGFVTWWCRRGWGRPQFGDVTAVVDAVRAAHAVAAVVVTRRGADPPTPADLPAPWSPDPSTGR